MKQRSYVTASIAIILWALPCYAQTEGSVLTNVKTPSSPASAIIGNQPSTIARPKSWEALETALFSNFLDSSNKFLVPDNYALEFSPYWAINRKISNADFINPKPSISCYQNLSFSVSSTNKYIINDTIETSAIGLGVRTMIWLGTREEVATITVAYNKLMVNSKLLNRLQTRAEKLSFPSKCKKQDFVTKFISDIEKYSTDVFDEVSMKKEFIPEWIYGYKQYLLDKLDSTLDYSIDSIRGNQIHDLTKKYLDLESDLDLIADAREERKGFKLELATALALNYPTNRTDFSYGSKFGIWVTPSFEPYKKKNQCIQYLGVLRYYWYNQDFSGRYLPDGKFYEHNFDYGFKAVLKRNTLSLELEGTGRISSVILSRVVNPDGTVTKTTNSAYDRQFIATLTYQINPNISISYNFGKAFKPVINYQGGNLLSMATINFGLGAPKISNLKE